MPAPAAAPPGGVSPAGPADLASASLEDGPTAPVAPERVASPAGSTPDARSQADDILAGGADALYDLPDDGESSTLYDIPDDEEVTAEDGPAPAVDDDDDDDEFDLSDLDVGGDLGDALGDLYDDPDEDEDGGPQPGA